MKLRIRDIFIQDQKTKYPSTFKYPIIFYHTRQSIEGSRVPKFYGISYIIWECDITVYALIPFNKILGLFNYINRVFWWWLKCSFGIHEFDKFTIKAFNNGMEFGIKRERLSCIRDITAANKIHFDDGYMRGEANILDEWFDHDFRIKRILNNK